MTQEKQGLERVEIYAALNKPNLIFGAERELILMSGVIAAALIVAGLTVVTTVLGITILLFSAYFLRTMGKSDAIMSKIFIRQAKYSKFYSAKSSPFCQN